jgi:hypothetical protein
MPALFLRHRIKHLGLSQGRILFVGSVNFSDKKQTAASGG